jgi:hypothetical protein
MPRKVLVSHFSWKWLLQHVGIFGLSEMEEFFDW